MPAPLRGVLTLRDLDHPQLLSSTSLPAKGDDAGLPHGILRSWTRQHQQSPGRGCHRGRIAGAGSLGISNPGCLISELMEMLQGERAGGGSRPQHFSGTEAASLF